MNAPNVYYCHAYNSERIKVKTCTCGNGKKSCPSHTYSSRSIGDGYYIEGSNSQINNTASSNETTNTESARHQSDVSECTVTVQANYESPIPDELKLSLTSLVTDNSDEKAKDRKLSYEKWLAVKNQQKREQEMDRLEIEERILMENKQKLFLEQDNFKRWLENKIALQKAKDEANRRKLEEEKRKLQEQEKKEELNKKMYKLWLKKKETEELAKKLKEQERKLLEAEEKKKRMQMNAEAFQDWMKSSVHKPKPVPLNRGLESLRSSVSVSYINPVPWTPNIQEPMKNNLAPGQFKYNRQIY